MSELNPLKLLRRSVAGMTRRILSVFEVTLIMTANYTLVFESE